MVKSGQKQNRQTMYLKQIKNSDVGGNSSTSIQKNSYQ
jgi:hypothetical protein